MRPVTVCKLVLMEAVLFYNVDLQCFVVVVYPSWTLGGGGGEPGRCSCMLTNAICRVRGLYVAVLKQKSYLYPATQVATGYHQRMYFCFWRVDAVMRGAYCENSPTLLRSALQHVSVVFLFLLTSVCCDTARAKVAPHCLLHVNFPHR